MNSIMRLPLETMQSSTKVVNPISERYRVSCGS